MSRSKRFCLLTFNVILACLICGCAHQQNEELEGNTERFDLQEHYKEKMDNEAAIKNNAYTAIRQIKE